ncbi:MAG: tRNA 2-thiocytidine(32) synthetase TtcA [Gammaproteobacteria bacterium]
MSNSSKLEKKLLHYTGKAIHDFKMIENGDRVLVALSGGKDSFVMLQILRFLQMRACARFQLSVLMVEQGFPGWDGEKAIKWLEEKGISHAVIHENIYKIVRDKVGAESKFSYCPLCSRLRRGVIYRYARENNFNKVALGHHRDDLIVSLMMFMLYNGALRSMPPKFLTDDKKLIVIRPLAYCQERDIIGYANECEFPLVSSSPCQFKENLMRKRVAKLIADLALDNPKVPSNILRAIQNVSPSQLMDRKIWDFLGLKIL